MVMSAGMNQLREGIGAPVRYKNAGRMPTRTFACPTHPKIRPATESMIHSPNSGMSSQRAWLTLFSPGVLAIAAARELVLL